VVVSLSLFLTSISQWSIDADGIIIYGRGLSITKASMGYRILTNPTIGPITVIGELFESTL
jgi:hypothetical protein